MSEADCTLAMDLGTGSGRAVVFDRAGKPLGIGQREWSHAELPDAPGSQIFDTERNWLLLTLCIREAVERAEIGPERIAAVSSTSMREGMVLYDAAGSEIWACPNVDSRASAEVAELVASGAAEQIYRRGGDWVSITSPARFLWIRHHQPEIWERIAHVGMLSDWVLTRLSGEYVTDTTCGSSSDLFDLESRSWSLDSLALLGLDLRVFPPVLESGTVMGAVTARAAQETGLRVGTPVVAGGADTQLGLIGIGVTRPNRFTIVGGSFWQATVVLDHPLIDPQMRLRTLCHVLPGQWMMEGIGFYPGLTMRWFRDAFCEAEVARATREGRDAYVLMEELAAAVPAGSSGVVPIFSNLMDAKRWVHASPSFLGFDIAHPERSGRRECIRAIQESAAYVARGHLGIIEELTEHAFDAAVFTGGGSKGTLWPQIIADVLGLPVQVPVVRESTALGAAMCAGVGAGLYDSLDEVASRIVRFERTVEPDPSTHAHYDELYEQWRAVYARQLEITEAGLLPPLWRAAGT
jgi:autoinducer 2 (AI-2) kinase